MYPRSERPLFLSERLPLTTAMMLIVLAVVIIVVIDRVIRELEDRSPRSIPRYWITPLRVLRVIFCVAVFGLALYVLFNPVGIVAVVLGAGVYLRSVFARRRDERDAVNTLVRMVADHGGAIPDALEPFANSCRSIVRRRSRDFAYWLRCGADVHKSALNSGLTLMPDTVVAVQKIGQRVHARRAAGVTEVGSTEVGSTEVGSTEVGLGRQGDDDLLGDTSLASELRWLSWPVSGQLLYLLTLIVTCMIMVTFIQTFIAPTMEKMHDDLGFYVSGSRRWVDRLFAFWPSVATAVAIIAGCWLLLVVNTAIAPTAFWIRMTPWFGPWVRERNRSAGLSALAGGLRRGETLSGILGSASGATGSRWLRMRTRAALERLQRGEGTAAALQRSGWVSRAEARWLQSAEANDSLATAMQDLATQIRRRYDLRWQLRLSWLVPVVTVVVAAVVAVQALAMFLFLTELVYGLA